MSDFFFFFFCLTENVDVAFLQDSLLLENCLHLDKWNKWEACSEKNNLKES